MSVMPSSLLIATISYVLIMMNTVAAQVGAYTILPQLFDKQSRYTGVALGWNFGVIIAGGSAPFVAVWLVEQTGNSLSPAFFVIGLAVVGLLALSTIRQRHTAHADLPTS